MTYHAVGAAEPGNAQAGPSGGKTSAKRTTAARSPRRTRGSKADPPEASTSQAARNAPAGSPPSGNTKEDNGRVHPATPPPESSSKRPLSTPRPSALVRRSSVGALSGTEPRARATRATSVPVMVTAPAASAAVTAEPLPHEALEGRKKCKNAFQDLSHHFDRASGLTDDQELDDDAVKIFADLKAAASKFKEVADCLHASGAASSADHAVADAWSAVATNVL